MIAYVDTVPTVEKKDGNFLVTMLSGGERIQLLLTRHALFGLGRAAVTESYAAFDEDKVIDFRRMEG